MHRTRLRTTDEHVFLHMHITCQMTDIDTLHQIHSSLNGRSKHMFTHDHRSRLRGTNRYTILHISFDNCYSGQTFHITSVGLSDTKWTHKTMCALIRPALRYAHTDSEARREYLQSTCFAAKYFYFFELLPTRHNFCTVHCGASHLRTTVGRWTKDGISSTLT
jgi:hypothetical protein